MKTTMDPVSTCDLLLYYLKQSNLNFHLSESPFSAFIEIKKTFIRNKNGSYRTSDLPDYTSKEKKVSEAENDALIEENKSLKTQLLSSQKEMASLRVNIEQLHNSQKILELKNDDLEHALEKKAFELDQVKISVQNNEKEIVNAEESLSNCKALNTEIKDENSKLREQVAEKDDRLAETLKENEKLEQKLNSLLDVLYGCPECGLNKCECNDSVYEDEFTSHPSPPPTPAEQHPPPPNSGSPPWTPPPTLPCTSCGGVNFGPSPSSLCFKCIPPLPSRDSTRCSSPSETPPGTPPIFR